MALADTYFKMAADQDDENLRIVLSAAGTAIQNLTNRLNTLETRINKLDALEAYGVDNWEGYDEAMRSIADEDEED
jgi:hypothetical protein